MLVLNRLTDQKVVVVDPSGNVLGTVMVVSVRGDKVRLGWDFPQEIRVHREEVWKEIQAERKAVQA